MLVRDGSSPSDGNHSVLVKAPLENGLLCSERTQLWFSHCPKKGLKASLDVVLLNAPLEEAQLAQILIVSDLVVLVIAPEMIPNRPQKSLPGASKSSSALQKTSQAYGPSKALDRSVWQPLEASRSPQAANPKP